MTYSEACSQLPPDAEWTAVFGNYGEGGCREYFRDKAGNRFVLSNGGWDELDPRNSWTVRRES